MWVLNYFLIHVHFELFVLIDGIIFFCTNIKLVHRDPELI